jgi:methylenetetrahydrofolate--tRNA-(uracil-5-)-methyltransferase
MADKADIMVVGGGLAGAEAAWQLAERGVQVLLCEMRPEQRTPAHQTDCLAEMVCSNSLGSSLVDRATGLLQEEMKRLGSLIVECGLATQVPAGGALAVDRERFAELVTEKLTAHPNVRIERREVTSLPTECPLIVASGPLTSPSLAAALREFSGEEQLYFYDAMAPIVNVDSIDMSIAFRASRWERGEREDGDYINCPLNKEQYEAFVEALLGAETIELRSFEKDDPHFFESCLPIEVLARRGLRALAYGPMRPVGLDDPRTGRWPYAIVQLRQDNLADTLYNLVGFQTNLRWPEQQRVLRMIPGLEHAEFVRFGQMHRNTFLNSPQLLEETMQSRVRPDLFFAGQIAGVEGYMGNAGSGLVAGINAARFLRGGKPLTFPRTTMLGALLWYISHAEVKEFQPMKANFGLLPGLVPPVRGKLPRYQAYATRALEALDAFRPQVEED